MKTIPNNAGKVLSRYSQTAGATAVVLNLRPTEAATFRAFVASIRLRGDKVPSLALVARRAIAAYMAHAQHSPETQASEIQALEKLATRFQDRTKSEAPQV